MKGVIVAAGYGTRFLPATKTVPKELLPLVDTPSLQFIIDEFTASGVDEILVISSRRKKALEDYLDREIELELALERAGKRDLLARIAPPRAHVFIVHQQEMRGTGHALLCARPFIGDEPFVVAYPDDLHFGNPPLTAQLIRTYRETGCCVLASIHDPPDLSRYGVLKLAQDGIHVEDMVEKPAPGTEPSREVSIGRYLFTPDVFPLLEEGWKAHTGGEYYHLYALRRLMAQGKVVHTRVEGKRIDTGEPSGYLEAILEYALTRDDLRVPLERWISRHVGFFDGT
ncbi:UTP--glucose-1-phosphate uridylyltransferase [Spirochaeta thermophila]|nr:UTP--glucose-1-phosphate uridylyltransferase [Spirochaeta thermophila]